MPPTHPHERTELRGRDAAVDISYCDPARADVRIWMDGEPGAAPEAARLACEAVHQARVRDALRVETALDVASPACGLILDALRRRRGNDLDGIRMRRAGSSVMVTLDLRPWPTLARMPVDRGTGLVPTQPAGSRPATGVPRPGVLAWR
jgi:hypothetical protein